MVGLSSHHIRVFDCYKLDFCPFFLQLWGGGGGRVATAFVLAFVPIFQISLGDGGIAGDSGDRLRVYVGRDLVFVGSLRYWPHVAQTSCYGSTAKSGGKGGGERGGEGGDQAEGKGQRRLLIESS